MFLIAQQGNFKQLHNHKTFQMYSRPIHLLLIGLLLVLCSCAPSREAPQKPNIVLILGDDMGYSDIGCYGGEIRTPNLDALAANGLRYTQFYNMARCCPTRASLLTGLYPQQAGVGHMVNDRGTPAYQGDLSSHAVTIAEALKSAGYKSYLAGKWHVTPYIIDKPDKHNWPLQRGFDKFFGIVSGAGSLYDPRSLANGNEYVAPREGFYATTDYTNHAIDFINNHQEESPFFLFLSHQAAHWPMHAPESAIAPYKGHYDQGWDVTREKRLQRMQQLGLIDERWKMTPRDTFILPWSDSIPDREWELANMEVYAAMTTLMDEEIGRLLSLLEEKGQLENTLVFYLQDNGACAEELQWISKEDRPDNPAPLAPGALQTQMVPEITRDGKPIKLMKDTWPGPPEGYTAYGLNWANVSNTPFREYKHWIHEGGISTPLIVHWPAKIKAGGQFIKEPGHLIDIMATCIEVAGAEYPSSYNGNPITPLEGKSLVPTFEQKNLDREAIYWEHEGNRAVRMGKWKLVSKASKTNSFIWDKVESLQRADWELFDMEIDRTEMHNIADDHPAIVEKMAAMWLAWAERTGTLPRPN